MIIFNWSLLLVMVCLVPYIIGTLLVTNMDKSYQTPAMNYICGWFSCFAIFEIIAVPFILLEARFTYVVIAYSIVLIAVMVFALIHRKRTIGNIFVRLKFDYFRIDKLTSVGWGIFGVLVILQIIARLYWATYDGDDPYFITIGNMANIQDIMYTRDAYTGFVKELDMRHAMSATPIFYAWLSRVSGVHVAAVAHSCMGPVLLIVMYAIYAEISKRLFKKQEKARPWFMILMCIWYVWGNISLYTTETFAINRTWQGKAILGNIVIPCILWCLMMLGEKRNSKGVWILLALCGIDAAFCSSISFMLFPTVVGIASIILGISKRSVSFFIKVAVTMLPCLILAGVYLLCR